MKSPIYGLALASLMSTPALAESADPTIIVTARSEADAAEQRVHETPGGADVVTYRDYADKTAVSLRDTLAFSPGIYTQPRFGQEVRISIRGSGLSRGFHMRGLTLLQDGIPINLADDNGDFQELEPIFFDHLEVYRGANALRFGSGTLGGAINGVTPSGDTAHGIYARLDGGSYEFVRGLVSAGFGDERASAWGALSVDRGEGDREHARRHSLRGHLNVKLKLSDTITTRFYGSANQIVQELPGALSESVVLTRPKTGSFAGDQHRNIDSIRLQNRTEIDLGDAILAIGAFLNAKQLFHPIYVVIDQKSTDDGLFARLDWTHGALSASLGSESRWGQVASRQYVNVNGRRGALLFQAQQRARTSNLYGEVRVEAAPGLSLIAGGIWADGFRKQVQTYPAAAVGRASFDAFSPKFGALWHPRPGIDVYANYSRSAEFPGFIELAQRTTFVPLSAQRAWTAEVGTRGQAGPIEWDVSLYRARLTGEMLQYAVDANIPASTFNAGRTVHQGVELALSATPAAWLRLRQTWLYSDFRFRHDVQFGNNRLPVVPRHVLRSEARFGSEALHVAPNLEWQPQGAWADYANTYRTRGYALVGLTAGATVRQGIDLFLDARNLTNRKAVGDISAAITASPASAIYYPVERRAVYGGVRARF